MNSLTPEQMRQHVPIVAWLNIAGAILLLLVGGFLLLLLPSIGAISGDREALGILSTVAVGVSCLFGMLALPGLIAGIGLLRRSSWGRILAIIVSFINLLNFPIGTIIGVYSLWVLFQDSAAIYFD
jgi:hypothetical protein